MSGKRITRASTAKEEAVKSGRCCASKRFTIIELDPETKMVRCSECRALRDPEGDELKRLPAFTNKDYYYAKHIGLCEMCLDKATRIYWEPAHKQLAYRCSDSMCTPSKTCHTLVRDPRVG